MLHRATLPQPRTVALAGIAGLIALLVGERSVEAQSSWVYSPYEIRLWIAFDNVPELSESYRKTLLREINDQAWLVAGAAWKLHPEPIPDKRLTDSILVVIDQITAEQIEQAAPGSFQADKVMMVSVRHRTGGYDIAARELDCRTYVMGRVARRSIALRSQLGAAISSALFESFSPVARVEWSEGSRARIRVRAEGLVTGGPANPAFIGHNSLLQPVLRRNERNGKPKRIDVIEWSYLRVDHREGALWDCELRTALRNPLSGRNSPRLWKLGLGVKPRGKTTVLQLIARRKRRVDGKEIDVEVPLEGYEIFAKNPLPVKKGEEKPAPIPLGRTDWRGMVKIEADPDYPLRLIYVKNGQFLIARLPLVPGLDPFVKTDLNSDNQRLEVEAFVKGIEATVVDIVAQRTILAARIRRFLLQGDRKRAQQYLDEFVNLPGKDALEQMIAKRRNSFNSPNRFEQRRIDGMLRGAQALIAKYLDNDLQQRLIAEVQGREKVRPPIEKKKKKEEEEATET